VIRKTRKLVEQFVDKEGRMWIIKLVSESSKGKHPVVTVPLPILKKLGFKKGDLVAFHLDEKAKTIMIRKLRVKIEFVE